MESKPIKIDLDGSGEATVSGNFFSGVVWTIFVSKNGQTNNPTVLIESLDNLTDQNETQTILNITESGAKPTAYRPTAPLQDTVGADLTQYQLFGVASSIRITVGGGDASGVVSILIYYVSA